MTAEKVKVAYPAVKICPNDAQQRLCIRGNNPRAPTTTLGGRVLALFSRSLT